VSSLRQSLAQATARLMVQEYIDDYRVAKLKAADRLGISHRHLPSNSEIEAELAAYQRLFCAEQQPQQLRQQRQSALAAMRLLHSFQPRLVGKVLNGTANPHSPISLHLFTDSHEDLAVFLLERRMPYELSERSFPSVNKSYPCYQFMAGDAPVYLTVFPLLELRQAPPDPVTGKPMRRADQAAVSALLDV